MTGGVVFRTIAALRLFHFARAPTRSLPTRFVVGRTRARLIAAKNHAESVVNPADLLPRPLAEAEASERR